jgi:hypothetical protein
MTKYTYAAEYDEYSQWLAAEALRDAQWCERCDGFGDHGLDEDGKLYVC